MSIILPDGYVLDTINPYMSDWKNNDANMTCHTIEQQNVINSMNDDDVMMLDRGFYCIRELDLEMKRMKCQMPSYLLTGVA